MLNNGTKIDIMKDVTICMSVRQFRIGAASIVNTEYTYHWYKPHWVCIPQLKLCIEQMRNAKI